MCSRTKQLPAGLWAPIVAIAIIIVCAGLAADILATAVPAMKEAPQCVI